MRRSGWRGLGPGMRPAACRPRAGRAGAPLRGVARTVPAGWCSGPARPDVHHQVSEPAVARGVPVVRIVGVEDHHHAGPADVAAPAAGERLRAGFGDAERVALVTVPVIPGLSHFWGGW